MELETLAERHPGITAELGATYRQSAAVCLSRHHAPPARIHVSLDTDDVRAYVVDWTMPGDRTRAAWANVDDATRDGAYGIVLAAADSHLGLVALGRTTVGSG